MPWYALTFYQCITLCGNSIHVSMQPMVHQGIPGCIWNVVQDQAWGQPHALLLLLINLIVLFLTFWLLIICLSLYHLLITFSLNYLLACSGTT